MTVRFRVILVVVGAMLIAACGSSSSEVVKLDGSPRMPSEQGVVVKADKDHIVLDGNRTYTVAKKLIAFSTFNARPISLQSTVNQYVQVGLKGNQVVWLARIGPVAEGAGRRTVTYQGEIVKVDGSLLIFKDGTVLTLAKGLHAPADVSGATIASINPERHVVEGATFSPATTSSTMAK